MSIDIATFRVRFPEFSDTAEYPDPRVQLFIDDSVLYIGVDETRWSNKYNLAQAYMAAHLLTLATNSSLGDSKSKGQIQSKSAGGVSVSYATANSQRSSDDELLASTIYGQQFLAIRNYCFVGVLVPNGL